MIHFDRDALICDLAETYSIYDYRSLPVHLVATLSYGLREDSRIKLALRGEKVSYSTMIQAVIADRLAAYLYDEEHQPDSIVKMFLDQTETKTETKSNVKSFATGEDFIAERNRLMEAING